MSRSVSAPLLLHLQSPFRTLANCWAIKPVNGPWETYCSLDRNLSLPSYGVIPASTYLCAGGVASTTIPASLNLSKSNVQVSVLAFNRRQLLSGYYRDAQFEAFIVNYRDVAMGRDVKLSGKLGTIQVGPVSATVELLPWNGLAEMSIGRTCNQLCDVGLYPGEQFGTHRCRNLTLQDGPLRDDWTVLSTITSVQSAHEFIVSHGFTARSGTALRLEFDDHLERGDVEFLLSDAGGENAGVAMQVKSGGTMLGVPGVALTLTGDLPFVPAVGDQLYLVAGCKREVADCQFFDNMDNFCGFNLLPSLVGVFNEKEEQG